ncbi:MAG: hypothetical protein IKM31_04885, partial [Oscillospiraceae bacterium]|nr:hypothetical protein [Oscillospiraceae bacterium]
MLHPNSAFHLFKDRIARLETVEKEDLLRDFLLESGSGLQICYAPHNEYINERAKILIVGITP